ncbi:hypothetical protein K470DRAFT_214745 [Piedraia hortae CBS 480.64]|uniref:Non-structural maintenance of chromosomes element 4 n=1 Tax=Piedraia hortae CBS 480.64 TaxID=1314780 RepID=A0A6A7C1W4_9PEZI|nr:hypothetical protein K470DRAFT_214745 [Piedraia hortae CBS 480.64]
MRQSSRTGHGTQSNKRQCIHDDGDEDGEDGDEIGILNKYYNPNQKTDERRIIKRKSRALERDFNDKRDQLFRGDGKHLLTTIKRADRIYQQVKQTSDATLDARLLVNVSDLANKKAAQLVLGDGSTGVDVGEFLTKSLVFLRRGRRGDEEEGVEAELDWAHLGREACVQFNRQPPLPSFLQGPISVEKKKRTQTQRRARQAKDTDGREARPEALTTADMQQSEENSLTARCARILDQLNKHIETAQNFLERAGFTAEQLETEHGQTMLKKHRIALNGGVSLFDFCVNPKSFGQTVENLFYTSFLIKEGALGVDFDENELPTIMPTEAPSLEERRAKQMKRRQAVFALDYSTWQALVTAFDIREPMIPHREEDVEQRVGGRGWYA